MKKFLLPLATIVVLTACNGAKNKTVEESTVSDSDIILYNAFSHNDYQRPEPLVAALRHNFNCVEADSYLVDGRFVVAHDLPDDTGSLKTLQEEYFEPLFSRVDSLGSVYAGAEHPFMLMVDIKRDGEVFYETLRPYLLENKKYFVHIEGDSLVDGPILLFFSGARPNVGLPADAERCAFLDGLFSDIPEADPRLMPVVSDDYEQFFTWDGHGEMPEDELAVMRGQIADAHARGVRIRYWGGPDTPEFMQLQLREGVDIVGTDDLPTLASLLK